MIRYLSLNPSLKILELLRVNFSNVNVFLKTILETVTIGQIWIVVLICSCMVECTVLPAVMNIQKNSSSQMGSNWMTLKRLHMTPTPNQDVHQTVLPRPNRILIRWNDFWPWIEKYLDFMRFGMIETWDLVKWDHSYSTISSVSRIFSRQFFGHFRQFG